MSKHFRTFAAASVIALTASAASAVTFTIDGDNSSVELKKISGIGDPITASLATGLEGTSFELTNPGDSETFDFLFFDVSSGWGLTEYEVEATLAFDPPAISATGGGVGGALVLFGSIVGGNLTWNTGVPASVGFAGGGEATIDFGGGTGLFLGGSETTMATVTLDVAPVPLPAAGGMLLVGLGSIAAMRRRKQADA